MLRGKKKQLKSDLFFKVASRAFPEIIFNIFCIFRKMSFAIQNETKTLKVLKSSIQLSKLNLNSISPHNIYQDGKMAYCVSERFYTTRNEKGFLVG